MNTYFKKTIVLFLFFIGMSVTTYSQKKINIEDRILIELSTLPVVGMFPKDGNIRYASAEIRGELLGATLSFMIYPFETHINVENKNRLDLSLSAHLLGLNWSQLFSKEQTTFLDWGYLRAGLSTPFYFNGNNKFFGRSCVRFQVGLGRVIINVPELTKTGYQWGMDISFSFTYKLND